MLWCSGKLSLHWRYNDRGGVSNHQPHGCLLNRLFRRRSKKTSKLRVTGLCAGNSPGPVNSPHKGPVTRKMFQFDDVIMINRRDQPLLFSLWQSMHVTCTWIWDGWTNNHIHYKMWNESAYPFPNFHGAAVSVWEWKSIFIPHFTEHVITYPCRH